jgi:molybdopterin molybdotransferase
MIEHVDVQDRFLRLAEGRSLRSGENIVPRGSESHAGDIVLAEGTVIAAAEIALAAACGRSTLTVYRRPRVAIVATGDELVELDQTPDEQQIRNSNSYGLAALVAESGAEGVRLPIARDRREDLEKLILQARSSDLLLLSGGVSMGKYDLVEEVLHSLGAEFFFTGVKMQPGKPVVFGRLPASGDLPARFFFGLPGNPVSTQVTFHCFVAPLLRAMGGASSSSPRFAQATLAEDVTGKTGLYRLLPAHLAYNRARPEVRVVAWQGSGDLAANARANCYAVFSPDKERFAAGDVITVMLR